MLGDSCVAQGVTASADRDINDYLTLNVRDKGLYHVMWMRDTVAIMHPVYVEDDNVDVTLSFE